MSNDRWGFNEWAKSYDKDVYDTTRPDQFTFQNYDRVLDRIVEYCDLPNNSYSQVLDIGIGTGNLAGRFLAANMDVIGIDPSMKMIEICQQKFPDIKLMSGHFLDILLPPQSVDIIISSYAFHHLTSEEKKRAIRIMKRVLKPGGRIVMADLMFRNEDERKRIERAYRKAGKPEIPEEYAEEFPGYFEDLQKTFTAEGLIFSGEQLNESVWIVCGCL